MLSNVKNPREMLTCHHTMMINPDFLRTYLSNEEECCHFPIASFVIFSAVSKTAFFSLSVLASI